jgi:hypothetical protein
VPDFPDANEDPYVNTFLAKHGLHYDEIPYDAEQSPVGEHLILGISPRGGMHAVVGVDGVVKMDPHPMDGTGRGLVKPLKYGALTAVKRRAQDAMDIRAMYESAKTPMDIAAATRAYNRLMDNNEEPFSPGTMAQLKKTAQERVASSNVHQSTGEEISTNMKMYTTARRPDLFRRAKDMSGYGYGMGKHCHLCGTPIDNGQKVNLCQACRLEKHYEGRVTPRIKADAEGIRKALQKAAAKDALRGEELGTAARALKSKHDEMWTLPTRGTVGEQTAYASMVMPVADLLREAEALLRSTRISDKAKWLAKLETGKKLVARGKAAAAKGDYASASWCVDSALSSAHYIIDALRALARRTGAKDMLSTRQLDKYSMQSLLDTLGIDIKAFIDRPPQQRDVMLETAFNELERLGKSSKKGGSVVVRAKDELSVSEIGKRRQLEAYFDRNGWRLPSTAVLEAVIKSSPDMPIDLLAKVARNSAAKERAKARAKVTDSRIITNPAGYRPCVGDKVGGVTIETIGSDTATLSNGTRIALKFLVSTRRTGEWKIGNTRGYDATDSRRTRLHRALDAVMDSARGRAKDAVSLCKVCRQYIPNVRGVLSRHYLNGKVCSGSGAEAPEYE